MKRPCPDSTNPLIDYSLQKLSTVKHAYKAVVESVNAFAVDLYLTTAENKGPGKNVLVSPLSAALATAMVHAGARGVTADEIVRGLRLPSDADTLDHGFKVLNRAMTNKPNIKLKIANRIYVEKSSSLKPEYNKRVVEVHASEVQTADFIDNAENERRLINEWVSKMTNNKINDLLPAGILSGDTRMVLVNALYFCGKWQVPFDKKHTRLEDFFASESKTVKVPMMHVTSKVMLYAEVPKLEAKVVKLYYKNSDAALQIILPDAKDGLAKLQKKLRTKARLSDFPYRKREVQLAIPKFKLEDSSDMKIIYQKMGMNAVFDRGTADLGGMTEGCNNMFISDAIQKTFMDVNEEGTEAAAATAWRSALVSAREPPPPVPFVADHPFMVRLVVGGLPQTGQPVCIFLGSVSDP